METLTWILSGLLAATMLMAGAMKATTPYAKLVDDARMAWAGDFTAGQVRAIGVAEILGAIGLVLPWLLDVVPVLTPIAALALAATMVGAVLVHLRRGETSATAMPAILGVVAIAVAVLRFGQLS